MRPTHTVIDLSAITHNYRQISQHVGEVTIMWVLKANAYGHGLVEIAKHLESLGASYFGVAFVEEGITLRNAGITSNILVLGGISNEQIPLYLEHDLIFTASSISKLESINAGAEQLGQQARVHLKVDTGMERVGTHYYNAEGFINSAFSKKSITVDGIYTHLSTAGENETYVDVQLKRWDEVLQHLPSSFTGNIHAFNSAAITKRTNPYNMCRCGLMLYGIPPSGIENSNLDLKPALSLYSTVVYFKAVKPNHPVGYGGTWTSDKLTRVVTIPIGYGDGYMRSMSHKAQVLINGKRYPVIGNICMDAIMVDIGQDSVYNGDSVTLIGRNGDERLSVKDIAEWAGTIPWEVMTAINGRVPRRYCK